MLKDLRNRVLVFDNYSRGKYLVMGIEAAHEAGWQALAFNKPHHANEELSIGVEALIVVPKVNLPEPYLEQEEFLTHANGLNLPRAVIGSRALVSQWVRPEHPDLIIPPNRMMPQIINNLSVWLGQLVMTGAIINRWN